MKHPIYADTYTSYYPYFTASKICIIYFSALELLFLFSFFPTFVRSLSLRVFNGVLIAVPISLLLYVFICLYVNRRMYINIRFDFTSISINNIKRKENLIIPWTKVEHVFVHNDNWPARKRYELILTETICNHTLFKKSKPLSCFIMINDVNILEIEKFIPTEKKNKK